MSHYRFNEALIPDSAPELQAWLGEAHANKSRPLCMCLPAGVPMYVARLGDAYRIKRMPGTGAQHAPDCDSFDPPPELSGLGQVLGSAILEETTDGTTVLKLGFTLTKRPGKASPAAAAADADDEQQASQPGGGAVVGSVASDGSKLTLRSLLHFLWDQSGLSKWSPAMAGKRSWYVVRKHLLMAAESKTVKSGGLADLLYIPEPFYLDRKAEIESRRALRLLRCQSGQRGPRALLIVVGEVKEIAASRYGHKLVLKHLPDFHFMLADDIHKRLLKRYADELALWAAFDESHLMAIGTFSMGPTGIASLEELAVMNTTEGWIPFENAAEKQLIDALASEGQRFAKGLRYNMATSRPLATALLTHTDPQPTAMYIVPPSAGEAFELTVRELIAASHYQAWVWHTGEENMPALTERFTPGQHEAGRTVNEGDPLETVDPGSNEDDAMSPAVSTDHPQG